MNMKLMTVFKILLWIFLLLVAFICYHLYYLPTHLHHQSLQLHNPLLTEQFAQFKIIYLSDLNYHPEKKEWLHRIIEEVKYQNPQLIIFGGNLLTPGYSPTPQESSELSEMLRQLLATHGKFFHFSTREYHNKQLQETINTIMHSAYFENISQKITHIHNYHNDYFQLVAPKTGTSELLSQIDNQHFAFILLPAISEIPQTPTSKNYYFLSGGTLGGLINIPFYGSIFPEFQHQYVYGYTLLSHNNPLYVTSGLSPDRPVSRLNTHNEIVTIIINP